MQRLILKPGKEKPLLSRHHWIFSGAISNAPAVEPGSILPVYSSAKEHLGYGYYNPSSQIAVRMLSFDETPFNQNSLSALIKNALARRKTNPLFTQTNAYRLIFSEGDFLPGLIVDQYAEHLVVQFLTLGMECLKPAIIEILLDQLAPKSIYERSDHESRKAENLKPVSGELYGTTPNSIIIRETNMDFAVQVKTGQKTGFFLDQRENRDLIRQLSPGKTVLNLFSYTGGFTVAAHKGGAKEVISVDSSEKALSLLEENLALNGITAPSSTVKANVFEYLRSEPLLSDLIIVDPPALAKKRGDINSAARAYKDLNLQVFKNCPPQSLILTCSCSRYMDSELFQKVIFSALLDAGKKAVILRKISHPADHPINLYHPESEYIKSLLLWVE